MHDSPKLGPVLVLLIVLIGPLQVSAFRSIADAYTQWQPQFNEHPSLQAAVVMHQCASGVGVLLWLYTAWLLFQRDKDTLETIKRTFLAGGVLRAMGLLVIPLFGGLAPEAFRFLLMNSAFVIVLFGCFTAAWFSYLARSQHVRSLYEGAP